MVIHREGSLAFAWIERKTPVLRPALQSKQSSLCGLHRSGDRGVGTAFSAREVKRAAAEERERNEYYSAEGQ